MGIPVVKLTGWEKRYPQHAMLDEHQPRAEVVKSFLDWLSENGYCVAKKSLGAQVFDIGPGKKEIENLIYRWCGMDREKFFEEKDKALEDCRNGDERRISRMVKKINIAKPQKRRR